MREEGGGGRKGEEREKEKEKEKKKERKKNRGIERKRTRERERHPHTRTHTRTQTARERRGEREAEIEREKCVGGGLNPKSHERAIERLIQILKTDTFDARVDLSANSQHVCQRSLSMCLRACVLECVQ